MTSDEFYTGEKFGFEYPEEYKNIKTKGEIFGESKWWFIGSSEGLFDVAYDLVNKDLKSKLRLIPFAKSQETNALACFDDLYNVYFIVNNAPLNRINWKKRFKLNCFSDFYQGAISGLY